MTTKIVIVTIIFIGFFVCAHGQTPKMKSAFNGKNLKGWVVPEDNLWWSAENGILSGKSDPELKGSIMWTEKEYQNFVIESDFLFGEGTVDSGIFLRTISQQIQIGISGSLKRDMTGSPYIEGKGYPVEATNIQQLLKSEDWNTMRVEAVGNLYKVWLNGQEVMSYESEDGIEKGPIGLQVHPNNHMSIDFRNIKIGEL